VEEDVWSKFGEGWKRKGGVEVGEKWWRNEAAADGRPVDRWAEAKEKGEMEGRKGKEGKWWLLAKLENDLNEVK
jgi:hypothetical protein